MEQASGMVGLVVIVVGALFFARGVGVAHDTHSLKGGGCGAEPLGQCEPIIKPEIRTVPPATGTFRRAAPTAVEALCTVIRISCDPTGTTWERNVTGALSTRSAIRARRCLIDVRQLRAVQVADD